MKFLNKLFYPYYWQELRWKIRDFVFPRQKWLVKKIPREHHDKDSLIEIVLFECLKNFVEEEIGAKELFDENRWGNHPPPEWQLKFENELKEHYLLLTHELPRLQKIEQEEWDKIPDFTLEDINNRKDGDYAKIYGQLDKADKDVEDLEDKIVLWVIMNRKGMWT